MGIFTCWNASIDQKQFFVQGNTLELRIFWSKDLLEVKDFSK
jgi:hypothetical protein